MLTLQSILEFCCESKSRVYYYLGCLIFVLEFPDEASDFRSTVEREVDCPSEPECACDFDEGQLGPILVSEDAVNLWLCERFGEADLRSVAT